MCCAWSIVSIWQVLASIVLFFADENTQILSEQKVGGKTNAKARCSDSYHITQIFFPLISHLLSKRKERNKWSWRGCSIIFKSPFPSKTEISKHTYAQFYSLTPNGREWFYRGKWQRIRKLRNIMYWQGTLCFLTLNLSTSAFEHVAWYDSTWFRRKGKKTL